MVLYRPAFEEKSTKRQKLIVRYARFVAVVLIITYPLLSFLIASGHESGALNWLNYEAVFDGVVGTLSALTLALLIARVDSELLGLSPWLISILFAYAAIQPLSIVFHQDPLTFQTIKTAVLLAVTKENSTNYENLRLFAELLTRHHQNKMTAHLEAFQAASKIKQRQTKEFNHSIANRIFL